MSRTPHPHSTVALQQAMDAALSAALNGPRSANPLVGASVLAADGALVTGWHRGAGTPHAEASALQAARRAGIDLTTATVCVTLEPCNHHGRTGPCSRLLLDAAVPQVIVACPDPDPQAAGGIAALREAGAHVRTGIGAAEAAALNTRWFRAVEQARPYVTLKLAQSLDGRIAAADGTSQWITGAAARERVHRLRASADAVMVGTGTALADDPRLSVRLPVLAQPSTPAGTETAAEAHPAPAAGPSAGGSGAQSGSVPQPVPVVMGLRDLPASSYLARDPRTVHLRTRDPLAGLRDLRNRGIRHVFAEGGAGLAAALIRADLVDSLEVHIAPILLGDGLPSLTDLGVGTLAAAYRWVHDPAADPVWQEWPDRISPGREPRGRNPADRERRGRGPAAHEPADREPPAGPASPDTVLRLLPTPRSTESAPAADAGRTHTASVPGPPSSASRPHAHTSADIRTEPRKD